VFCPRALSSTLTYPTVLTIVHCDGTSILSLHNILLQEILREFREEAPKEIPEAAFEGGS
jgi:hypothetical protein